MSINSSARVMRYATGILFTIAWVLILYRPAYNYHIIEMRNQDLLDAIFPFYPLLFLPLFAGRTNSTLSIYDYLQIGVSGLLCAAGQYTGIQCVIWIGGIWLGLTLIKAFGLQIATGGKLLFLLTPPFTHKSTLVFGFPLRLKLTQFSVQFLKILDPTAVARGNIINFQEGVFSVDPACEGLKMLIATILLFLIIQRRYFLQFRLPRKQMSPKREGRESYQNSLFMNSHILKNIIPACIALLVIVLWLISNLIRIIILVIGNIPPESPKHDFIGIIIFLITVAFPILVIYELLVPHIDISDHTYRNNPENGGELTGMKKNSATTSAKAWHATTLNNFQKYFATGILSIFCIMFFLIPDRPRTKMRAWPEKMGQVNGIKPVRINIEKKIGSEIAVYRVKSTDIILKQNLNPIRVGHHPRRCFEGMGYQFLKENDLHVSAGVIRESHLKIRIKGKDKHFKLIWWYQPVNAKGTVSSEIEWRRRTFLEQTEFVQVNLFSPVNINLIPFIENMNNIRFLQTYELQYS